MYRHPLSLWTSAARAISCGEKRVLKGAVRQKQAAKTRCLAETCYGESHEACIALRERNPLTDLACDVSQSSGNHILVAGVRTRRLILSELDGNIGQPDLPYVHTGEPRRADGAASNTPPKAFCWSPSC